MHHRLIATSRLELEPELESLVLAKKCVIALAAPAAPGAAFFLVLPEFRPDATAVTHPPGVRREGPAAHRPRTHGPRCAANTTPASAPPTSLRKLSVLQLLRRGRCRPRRKHARCGGDGGGGHDRARSAADDRPRRRLQLRRGAKVASGCGCGCGSGCGRGVRNCAAYRRRKKAPRGGERNV